MVEQLLSESTDCVSDDRPDQPQLPPISVRRIYSQLAVVALVVVLADQLLYQKLGYSSTAIFIASWYLLVLSVVPRTACGNTCSHQTGENNDLSEEKRLSWLQVSVKRFKQGLKRPVLVFSLLLLAACLRLVINGNVLLVSCAVWLLFASIYQLWGRAPNFLETVGYAFTRIPGGMRLFRYFGSLLRKSTLAPLDEAQPSWKWNIIIPCIAAVGFGFVLVMANPDISQRLSTELSGLLDWSVQYFEDLSMLQVMLWVLIAVVTAGLLYPPFGLKRSNADENPISPQQSFLYEAFRNTLLTLIALFVAYLVFELRAFKMDGPPAGFTYSSYAHEGAAWLTIALAMTTVTLSLIFRGGLFADPRLAKLQRLAWVWVGLNLLLAIAAYNRMWMYVDYNGMTRMRVVGLLGITSVVAGLFVLLAKIQHRQNFEWLLQRQIWILLLAVFTYAILPIDLWTHRYNVWQIQNGHLAPLVQITAHEFDDEALPALLPLTNVDNPDIANGISALLSIRLADLKSDLRIAESSGWQNYQWANTAVLEFLTENEKSFETSESDQAKQRKWGLLQEDAYNRWW